ncbi:MAG: diacylglycerol kinase family protein [Microthrixaceae bacterium]
MTIRRGASWGAPGSLPADAPVLEDDRSAAAVLQAAYDAGEALPVIGLVGGDLHRTMGSPRHDAAALREGRGMRFPIDLGLLEPDPGSDSDADPGSVHRPGARLFLAHLVARTTTSGGLWRGRTVVVMNAAFVGTANLGPRAHPNDGRLDVTDGSLGWTDRRAARRRAPSGAHVPHPALTERRVRSLDIGATTPMQLVLDGVDVGRSRRWRVRCLPDAAEVVV